MRPAALPSVIGYFLIGGQSAASHNGRSSPRCLMEWRIGRRVMGAGDKLTAKLARRTGACFIVRDANGQALAYVYFEGEPGRRAAAKLLTPMRARAIGAKIANLPELLSAPGT
jgi:hypothetical protein